MGKSTNHGVGNEGVVDKNGRMLKKRISMGKVTDWRKC